VRHEQFAVKAFKQRGCDVSERRCGAHHVVGDAGQALDERCNRDLRIDQRAPVRDLSVRDLNHADFGDPVAGARTAGCFQIDENERRGVHDLRSMHQSGMMRRRSLRLK